MNELAAGKHNFFSAVPKHELERITCDMLDMENEIRRAKTGACVWSRIGSCSPVYGGWFYGVMVSTLDFESSDPSSNLGRTCGSVLKGD